MYDTLKFIIKYKFWFILYIIFWIPLSLCLTFIFSTSTRGLAFLLALPLALIALYLAYRRTEALESQNKINSDRLVAETFAKSIELLGHKEASVRQGAIYALGKLAGASSDSDDDDLKTTVNTLCAFIRHNQPRREYKKCEKFNNLAVDIEKATQREYEKCEKFKNLGIDIEAAIKVIVKLSNKFKLDENLGETRYDLSNIYLPYADFSHAKLLNFNLSDSYFYEGIFENVDFSYGNLISSVFEESDFTGAIFNKETEIKKTDFSLTKGLNKEMIKDAQSDSDTKLPWGIASDT